LASFNAGIITEIFMGQTKGKSVSSATTVPLPDESSRCKKISKKTEP
jgi:hypothetical protein